MDHTASGHRRRGPRALLGLALALLALGACKKDSSAPEVAAERFVAHVARGDARAIWDSLTEGAQARLRARHEALVEATGGDRDPEAIVEGLHLEALGEAETPVVVSPLGDRVTVRLSSPRGSTDLELVRDGAGWKVDLTLTSSVADEDPQGQ